MGDLNTTITVRTDDRFPAIVPGMKRKARRRAVQRFEALEERLLWSVGQDANGWTVVTEPTGSNVIYVSSSSGSDSNPGTIGAPVATLSRAQALSVSGPNEILLKSGDTFNESASNTLSNWKLSGQSAQNPFVLSYYGSGARPVINVNNNGTGFYISAGNAVSNVDILGLNFEANLRDPTLGTVNVSAGSSLGEDKGIEIQGTGSNFLIEDCSVQYFGNNGGDNIDVEGNGGILSNVSIRRCVVNNAYGFNAGKCEGLYSYNVSSISVTQSTFDHNGWNGTYLYLGAEDIGYNHDMYFGPTDSGVDIEQNVISNASYAGVMARSGGTINYNLFLNDAVACSFGSADGVTSTIGGVSGSLVGNVVMGDRASQTIYYNSSAGAYMIGAGLAFGQGFVIANTAPSANVMVTGNIFTGDTQNAKPAITLTMATTTTNPSQAVGINNLTVSNNIVNGWRQAIQTDGRFVPGGTGLYALNGLTISHNDWVNSTTQLVRHDGGFAASAESWSGDRYIVTPGGLAQSNWVTLQSNNFSFTTWAASYDIGATALTVLPYSDPTRSAAKYDGTVGGPSTNADLTTNASQLSIYNFRPIYMAQAVISYIDAGFNLTSTGPVITGGGGSGSTGSSSPGVVTATASASNVNTASLGTTTYSFTVNYVDQFVLNSGKLGNSNILVTGPNGFYQLATFVSAASPYVDANSYQHTVATYSIKAPNGAWAKGEDGIYTITLMPNQPLDSSGNYAQEGTIGTFVADLTNPIAAINLTNITNGFTITYTDASGIDLSTLNSFEVQVTGPSNYSAFATLSSETASGSGNTVICSYTVTGPGGSWASAPSGTYTITLLSGAVGDIFGNTVPGGVLATYLVGSSNTGTGSIAGVVFNDANGNGIQDARELPMTGITVFIDKAGTGVYVSSDPTTTTDSNGNYSFTSLVAGRYSIIDLPPTGYGATSPNTGVNVVTLTTGQAATAISFGNELGATTINSTGSGGTTTNTSGGTITTGNTGTTGSGKPAKPTTGNNSNGNNNKNKPNKNRFGGR